MNDLHDSYPYLYALYVIPRYRLDKKFFQNLYFTKMWVKVTENRHKTTCNQRYFSQEKQNCNFPFFKNQYTRTTSNDLNHAGPGDWASSKHIYVIHVWFRNVYGNDTHVQAFSCTVSFILIKLLTIEDSKCWLRLKLCW